MKALCAMLCIAIAFVMITGPQRSQTHAGDDAAQAQGPQSQPVAPDEVDQLAGLLAQLQTMHDQTTRDNQDLLEQTMELSKASAAIEQRLNEELLTRGEVEKLVSTAVADQVASSECRCDCNCTEQLAELTKQIDALKARVAELEQLRTAAPVAAPTHASAPRPAPLKAIAKAATAPVARAGHWTYPGEIGNHLNDAQHAGQLQALGISTSGMTREQMLDLHDALHEGRPVQVRRPSPQPVVQYQTGNCPGGVCPTSGGCPGGVCPTQGYTQTRGGGLLGFGILGRR